MHPSIATTLKSPNNYNCLCWPCELCRSQGCAVSTLPTMRHSATLCQAECIVRGVLHALMSETLSWPPVLVFHIQWHVWSWFSHPSFNTLLPSASILAVCRVRAKAGNVNRLSRFECMGVYECLQVRWPSFEPMCTNSLAQIIKTRCQRVCSQVHAHTIAYKPVCIESMQRTLCLTVKEAHQLIHWRMYAHLYVVLRLFCLELAVSKLGQLQPLKKHTNNIVVSKALHQSFQKGHDLAY